MHDGTFLSDLRVEGQTFDLLVPAETAQTASGEVIRAALGSGLWRGTLSLAMSTHQNAASIEARLARLVRPGATFDVWDVRRVGPNFDPTGAILGAASPTVHSSSTTWIRITGLPPSYRLRRGDWLAFDYGSSPVRRALHRVWTVEAVANASGLTPQIEVEPLIRPGLSAGAAVSLIRPACRAAVLSAQFGRGAGVFTEDAEIAWTQVLR